MIDASLVQIAVLLTDATAAQLALDAACPGVFDVSGSDRTVWADASDPTVPKWAVAQGRVEQDQYALLAAAAPPAPVNHLAVGVWIDDVFTPAANSGTLWGALDIVPLEEEI